MDTENTSHYLLHCQHYNQLRVALTNSVKTVYDSFEYLSDSDRKSILLYGDPSLDGNQNRFILLSTLTYIKHSERFSGSLLE